MEGWMDTAQIPREADRAWQFKAKYILLVKLQLDANTVEEYGSGQKDGRESPEGCVNT
jgi:hypothetical protein